MANLLDEKILIDNALKEINLLYTQLSCNRYKDIFRIAIPIHCYTNFKDAVFHYYRICNSYSNQEKLNHYFAMTEHINRSKVDLFSSHYHVMSYCLENMINNLKTDTTKANIVIELRKILHMIKVQIFIMRFNGMSMIPGQGRFDYQGYTECCDAFLNAIIDNNLLDSFVNELQSYA